VEKWRDLLQWHGIGPNPTHISYVFVCIMRVTPLDISIVTRILGYTAIGQLNLPLFYLF
jgi:hypothetical protein